MNYENILAKNIRHPKRIKGASALAPLIPPMFTLDPQ